MPNNPTPPPVAPLMDDEARAGLRKVAEDMRDGNARFSDGTLGRVSADVGWRMFVTPARVLDLLDALDAARAQCGEAVEGTKMVNAELGTALRDNDALRAQLAEAQGERNRIAREAADAHDAAITAREDAAKDRANAEKLLCEAAMLEVERDEAEAARDTLTQQLAEARSLIDQLNAKLDVSHTTRCETCGNTVSHADCEHPGADLAVGTK